MSIQLRLANIADLPSLLQIESTCFSSDRLSRRSFKHYLSSEHGKIIVAERDNDLLGYGLIWLHKGTRLARLYSLAVLPQYRGQKVAQRLLQALESLALEHKRFYMRLEVSSENSAAIALYEQLGYRVFGRYSEYYDDKSDALRMQKRIRAYGKPGVSLAAPWYQQTTEFTCGPATLLMAMAGFDNSTQVSPEHELAIWREATTIFMTAGHGGCHPFGLALAAQKRGFSSHVVVNTEAPLFVESVRDNAKKVVIERVHQDFFQQCQQQNIAICYAELDIAWILNAMQQGYAVVVLISTYRFDGKKAPHWVLITGVDDDCVFVHDPDVDTDTQTELDCQHIPIGIEAFVSMAAFGGSRLRAAVALKQH